MQLTFIDWAVVALYFLFNLGVGLYYRSRAESSVDEFFLSGRNVPWWLAGTSMVAATFAADTPLAVTGMVAVGGIAGNWLWWCFVASGMLTVFFYARLWRRSGVMTDIEFAEIRYAGKPAAVLRGFRALYLGIPINCIVLGWVNKAMVDILTLVLGITERRALLIVLGIITLTAFISTLSGLWGVLVTDLFQFVIKMGMVIVLAVYAVKAVGGIDAMKQKLALVDAARVGTGAGRGSVLNFVPDLHSAWMPLIAFLVYISLNWWATWYPGAEPGGGGYIAQRMLSARDEKHSLLATLWFNVAHSAVRPWPWILVALASLILFPGVGSAGDRLRPGDDPGASAVAAWTDARGVCGCLYVHYCDATELGRQLFGQRFLSTLCPPGRAAKPLRADVASGDRILDAGLRHCDLLYGFHRRCMETTLSDRGRYRRRASAAVVLVAHQRLERGFGDAIGIRRICGAAMALAL